MNAGTLIGCKRWTIYDGRAKDQVRCSLRLIGGNQMLARYENAGDIGDVGEFRPWHRDGHAIVNAAFAVDFDSQPTPSTVRELLALHSKVRKEYPRKQELNLGKFNIEAIHSTGEVRTGVVGGGPTDRE